MNTIKRSTFLKSIFSKLKVFRESKILGLDTTEFETNQVFFRSKDGKVKVPMFIVNRRVSLFKF